MLSIDVGQHLVIRMEHKGLGLDVMTPMFQSSNNGIEFLVISRVVELRTSQLLTKESYRVLDLSENCTNSNATSITFDFK